MNEPERPPPEERSDARYLREMREMNESLLVSSVHQQELTELAQQAERASATGERHLRDILDALPAAVYTTDAEGRLTHFNPACVEFSGRTPRLGSDYWCVTWRLYHTDGTPMPRDEYPMAIALKERRATRGAEAIAERPDGTRIWFELYPTPLFDASGELIGGINMLVDITERKKAELAMMHLAAIVATSDDAIISKDLDGVIASWNTGAEHLFGYAPEEVIGKSVYLLILEERRDEEVEILRRVRRGDAVSHYETVRRRKDGTLVDISLTVSPLRDETGQIIGASSIARNTTERVRARQELSRAAEELADMNRRKDEFLAMLSHELRNPLAPIRTAVHLMRTQERGSENLIQQQAREIIERQVGNLTKIVNDLLEVSRVVSGRIRLDQQTVDVNLVVRHAVEAAHLNFEQRKHTVSLKLEDEGVWVNADVTRLEEVLVNLLNNAAKYTPDGGHVEVYCEQPTGATYVEVRVRDNGVGIEEELLRDGRIFDLFTQADRSLARSAGGLGIGLSLAHRLVALHGGSIEAKSPPDGAERGSEFIVRLPLVPPPPQPESHESELPMDKPEGLRVLVVDDNIDQVMMLSTLLRHEGYSVQSAYSGPEGLKVAQQWRPDVVLLDIGLPGLDGYEVARRLRADPTLGSAGATMRLIAITGYGLDTDLARAREAGFDNHLTKPAEFKDLEKVMAPPRAGEQARRG